MRPCPESAYILAFFALRPPLSDENPVMLHFFAYAEIIFAHILVFPACAITTFHFLYYDQSTTDLEFKVKIQNDPNKKITTISESSVP